MRDKQKRHPQEGWTDGEVVVEVAGARDKLLARLTVLAHPRIAEARVGVEIVVGEVQGVFDQRRPGECVVAYPVAANPGIHQRQGKKKDDEQCDF